VTFEYTICHDESTIIVKTQGVFDYLKIYDMWKGIVAACKANDCFDVIGLSGMEEPMPAAEAYDYTSLFEATGITPKHRIAWVASEPEVLDRLRAVELVLANRGPYNIHIFEILSDAKRWLKESA